MFIVFPSTQFSVGTLYVMHCYYMFWPTVAIIRYIEFFYIHPLFMSTQPFVQASHSPHKVRPWGIQKHTPHTHRPNTQPEHQYKIVEKLHNNKIIQPATTLVNITKNLTTRDTRDTNNKRKKRNIYVYLLIPDSIQFNFNYNILISSTFYNTEAIQKQYT
jgi:hypothetical protein